MKQFYITGYIGEPKKPDLGVSEKTHYSVLDLDGVNCLVRVSTTPDVHALITGIVKTDDEALILLNNIYPDVDLTNMDVPDLETNNILKLNGYDPDNIRRNSGKTLREQEFGALEQIAKHKGKDISDLKNDVKKGRCDAHEKALKRLR